MEWRQQNYDRLLMSPSSSPAPTPSGYDTQYYATYHDRLLELNISEAELDGLVREHNRRIIPIIDDEAFYKRLFEKASTSGGIDAPKVAQFLRDETDHIAKDFRSARGQVFLDGLEVLDTKDQKDHLNAGTGPFTAQGHYRLIAYTLPFLIKQAKEQKSRVVDRRPARRKREPRRRSARIEKMARMKARFAKFAKSRSVHAKRMIDPDS